jgi:hypothetical protein
MEAEIIYYAKDGRRFLDPLKCEEYERTLGLQPGTWGYAREWLRALGEGMYLNGYIAVRHEGRNAWHHMITTSLDDYLCDYVNVDELTDDKRWTAITIGEMIKYLDARYNDDDECIYLLTYCKQKDFKCDFGATEQQNQNFWENSKKDSEEYLSRKARGEE